MDGHVTEEKEEETHSSILEVVSSPELDIEQYSALREECETGNVTGFARVESNVSICDVSAFWTASSCSRMYLSRAALSRVSSSPTFSLNKKSKGIEN